MKPLKLLVPGSGGTNRMLTVPAEIARQIPDGSTFTCELTEVGLLYRPVTVPAVPAPVAWLRQETGSSRD